MFWLNNQGEPQGLKVKSPIIVQRDFRQHVIWGKYEDLF